MRRSRCWPGYATDGTIAALDLGQIRFARQRIEDAPSPEDPRVDGRSVRDEREGVPYEVPGETLQIAFDPLSTITVTDLAYLNGAVLVAGASNEEFVSSLRWFPFPFDNTGVRSSLEIFHVNHGKYETASPIRTMVPYGDGSGLIASYTCTPIVHFSVAELAHGRHVHGRTVTDLGGRNTPMDMITFRRDGEEYLVVCNSRRPLLRLSTAELAGRPPLTEANPDEATVPHVSLPHEGVLRMAQLGPTAVLMLQENGRGGVDLRSCPTSDL